MRWLTEAAWLNRRRVTDYPKIFLVMFVLAAGYWVVQGDGLVDRRGVPFGSDFISFWAASALALQGKAAAAYDIASHHAAQRAAVGAADIPYYAWFYPPTYLVVVLPLSLLPYGWSVAAWLAATFTAYLGVVRRIAQRGQALWLAAAFPAVLVNVAHGQNGFLIAALLGGALLLLDRRPWLAGMLIGLMTVKPQLGVLIPLALIADARWLAFLAAAATSIVLVLASLALFGADAWSAFYATLPAAGAALESGALDWAKMESPFAAVALLGGGVTATYIVQGLVAALVAAATVWAWRRPVDTGLKAAALATGTVLVTPHVFDYDFVILALPIAWLGREGLRTQFLAGEKFVLAAAWFVPFVSRVVAVNWGVSLGPLVAAALLLLILRRIALTQDTGALALSATARPQGGNAGPSDSTKSKSEAATGSSC